MSIPVSTSSAVSVAPATRLFLRQFGVTGLARVAALLIVSANLFFLAPWLGPAPFGDYLLVTAVVSILSWFATSGFPAAAIRWLPHYRTEQNQTHLQAFTRYARWSVARRLAALVVVGLVVGFLGRGLDQPVLDGSLWFAGLALLAGNAVLHLLTGELQGQGQTALGQFLFDASRHALQFGIVIGIASTGGAPLAAAAILWWQVSGTGLGILWALVALTRQTSPLLPVEEVCIQTQRRYEGTTAELQAKWEESARTAGISALSLVYLAQVDMLILGSWLGSEVAGPYGLATRLAGLTTFGLTTANTAMSPALAVAAQAERCPSLQPLVARVSRWGWAATVPLVLGMGAIGWWGAELFGTGYEALRLPLLILLVGQLCNAWCGPCLLLLNLSANGRWATQILLASCVLQTLLVCLLIPLAGGVGVALAVSLTTIVWNLWARHLCRTRLWVETAVFNHFLQTRKKNPV